MTSEIAVADRIPLVDLDGQYRRIQDEIKEAIHRVLDSSRFIKGPEVTAFEEELAAYLGGRHAIGVGSGTDALQVILMALDIGPGDEVITSPFSFVAAAEAAALLGATPVFADIEPDSFNLDPNSVEELINERTKAIIPVHLFGQPAEMDAFLRLGEKHGVYIIEDNAQAIGAEYRGRKTGFLGHIGCLSFFPSKNLGAFGDGGAVLTNDEKLASHVRTIANHGAEKKYYNNEIGVNSRLDSIQAAILRVKLGYLDEFIGARVAAADRYDTLLEKIENVGAPARLPNRTHVFHQYTIRVQTADAAARDQLAASLNQDGISTALYYPVPIHELDPYRECPKPRAGLSETERACSQVLSLPMHTELTEEQTTRVIQRIAKHLPDMNVQDQS
jgi:dTDP-4-amino-4,6-dideoxygalactose transaminase